MGIVKEPLVLYSSVTGKPGKYLMCTRIYPHESSSILIGRVDELGRELGHGLRPNSGSFLGLESLPNSTPTRQRPAQRVGFQLGLVITFTFETQLDMKPGANRKCRVGFELGLVITYALRNALICSNLRRFSGCKNTSK